MRSPPWEGDPCCSLFYLLVRRALGTGRRPRDERDIELLVLRHQVKVLQRQVKRPRLHRLDRLLLAAASRAMPRGLWSSFAVRPETLLRCHRELVRRKWTYKRRGRPGRPPIDPEVRAPHRPVGQGESPVGLPAHPRRAVEAGPPGLGDDRPNAPAPPRSGSGSPKDRPFVVRVPPCLREALHGAAAASGAGPGHAWRRLLVPDSAG